MSEKNQTREWTLTTNLANTEAVWKKAKKKSIPHIPTYISQLLEGHLDFGVQQSCKGGVKHEFMPILVTAPMRNIWELKLLSLERKSLLEDLIVAFQ